MLRGGRASRGPWRAGSVLLTALTILTTCPLAALTALFAIAAGRDWQIQAILTSSMHPALERGSLTVVVPEVAANIEPGMPIAYRDPLKPERIVVHRVVKVSHYGNRIYFGTKGDLNRVADFRPVPERNLIGRVRWNVPYVGAWMNAMRTRGGALLLIGLPALAVLADWIVRRRRRLAKHRTLVEADLLDVPLAA